MRALVVGNVGDGDPGIVGARLEHHGYRFERVDRDHPDTWPSLDGCRLVLVMGSEWSVYWPDLEPQVGAEAEALRECARRGIPVFAICFGSQMAAHALGGRVYRAERKEIGWSGIDSSVPEIAGGPWMQWHSDRVDLPEGAELLAENEIGPQAWSIGSFLCTQFHPEATAAIVERWVRGGGAAEAQGAGVDPEQLIRAGVEAETAARPNAERLVDWFCERFGR